MKKILLMITVFVGLLGLNKNSNAQFACVNCADIITQLISYGEQLSADATQVLQYENQILQYEAMLKHLEQNPLGVTVPDYLLLIKNAQLIEQNGVGLAHNLGDVTKNLSLSLKNPSLDNSMQFQVWTQNSQNAWKAAAYVAGEQRKALIGSGGISQDQQNVQNLVNNNHASVGDLSALKSLGDFAAAQLQESMKMRDVVTQSQIAVSTAMTAEASKSQQVMDNDAALQAGLKAAQPPIVYMTR